MDMARLEPASLLELISAYTYMTTRIMGIKYLAIRLHALEIRL
jgi:hypothetical protein